MVGLMTLLQKKGVARGFFLLAGGPAQAAAPALLRKTLLVLKPTCAA